MNCIAAVMNSGVACRAQRDQVFLCVVPRMAAEFPVVRLKIRHRASGLTPPAVPMQNLLAQTFVRQGIQPRECGFLADHSHAFSRRFSRKTWLFAGQELVITRDRVEQDLRVAIVQVRSPKKVGADHLQAVTTRLGCS